MAVTFNASLNVLNLWLDGQHLGYSTTAATARGQHATAQDRPQGAGRRQVLAGKIDDVRVWSVARTGVQIQGQYRCELSGPQRGLVANWQFDEGGSER